MLAEWYQSLLERRREINHATPRHMQMNGESLMQFILRNLSLCEANPIISHGVGRSSRSLKSSLRRYLPISMLLLAMMIVLLFYALPLELFKFTSIVQISVGTAAALGIIVGIGGLGLSFFQGERPGSFLVLNEVDYLGMLALISAPILLLATISTDARTLVVKFSSFEWWFVVGMLVLSVSLLFFVVSMLCCSVFMRSAFHGALPDLLMTSLNRKEKFTGMAWRAAWSYAALCVPMILVGMLALSRIFWNKTLQFGNSVYYSETLNPMGVNIVASFCVAWIVVMACIVFFITADYAYARMSGEGRAFKKLMIKMIVVELICFLFLVAVVFFTSAIWGEKISYSFYCYTYF